MSVEFLNLLLWGRIMPILMIGVGVYLTLRSGFFQVRKFGDMLRMTVGRAFSLKKSDSINGLSPWETVSTALASTLGTGSIIGIALAIKEGGAGSVFWMWISALLGMITKYSEIVLSMRFRQKDTSGFFVGGPMYYLKNGLRSKFLSVTFACLCLLTCFGIGNSVQANAISSVLKKQASLSPVLVGIILAVLVGIVILGGVKRVAGFNAKLVPFMSILYIGCCVMILILRIKLIPEIFLEIFKSAFSFPSAVYGVSSYGFLLAMKSGFSKGIFSNEAGLGSAPIAHASSGCSDEAEQGMWGMFEVFFTTVIICTLTAFVVLSCDGTDIQGLNGSEIALFAFQSVLPWVGGISISLSIILFSLSTILGWAFYGEICLSFLFKNATAWTWVFRVLFVFAAFFGAIGEMDQIWGISELINALMAIPNLIGVILLSETVMRISKEYFPKK